MRLGDVEQRILLACLAQHEPHSDSTVDMFRADLLVMLWGSGPVTKAALNARHASLTRALGSLHEKGLVRFGYTVGGCVYIREEYRGVQGREKAILLTPLGVEVAFLRITWEVPKHPHKWSSQPIYRIHSEPDTHTHRKRPRRPVKLTRIVAANSIRAIRTQQKWRRSWLNLSSAR
jgi:hypothetical protein